MPCCKDKCECAEKPNPSECTPEQIRECHGDAAEHPCETASAEEKKTGKA